MRKAVPHSHHSRRSIFRKFSRKTAGSVLLGLLVFDLSNRNHHWLVIQVMPFPVSLREL